MLSCLLPRGHLHGYPHRREESIKVQVVCEKGSLVLDGFSLPCVISLGSLVKKQL